MTVLNPGPKVSYMTGGVQNDRITPRDRSIPQVVCLRGFLRVVNARRVRENNRELGVGDNGVNLLIHHKPNLYFQLILHLQSH